MIELKEIINRKYDGKEPVSFEYVVKNLEGSNGVEEELSVWFKKIDPSTCSMITNKPTYKVFTIIEENVYQHIFEMPKNGMPLTMVVAYGLTALSMSLLEEISRKETIAYTISDITKDM